MPTRFLWRTLSANNHTLQNMDLRTMDSLPFDSGIMIGPFMIAMVGLATIIWFAMLGGSLKMSLGMLVDEPPGYLRCLVMAVLILFINVAVIAGLHLTARSAALVHRLPAIKQCCR